MQSYSLKLVLVGDSRVGKSQLSRAFMDKEFKTETQVTVGIEFTTMSLPFEKSVIHAQIWDTAGQDRFSGMTKAFYRNTAAALLVYDICSRASFLNLKAVWLKQLRENGYGDVRMVLVGNKADLAVADPADGSASSSSSSGRKKKEGKADCKREVSAEEARAWAEEEHFDFVETSALTGHCVERTFRRAALAVAQELPALKVHMEVSFLPPGWIVKTEKLSPQQQQQLEQEQQEREEARGDCSPVISVSAVDISVSLPASPTPTPATSDERASICLSGRYCFVNYWTGEETSQLPTRPAPSGLLHSAPIPAPPGPWTKVSKDSSSSCDEVKTDDDRSSLAYVNACVAFIAMTVQPLPPCTAPPLL